MKETYISSSTSSASSSKVTMISSSTSTFSTASSIQMNGNVSSSSSVLKENCEDNVEYMEVDSNEERISFNDVPALMKKPLKMNDFWFIVDKTWFDKFNKFLETNDAAYHPGPIDNSALLDPVKNNAQKNYSEPLYRLKKDLVEDEQYVVVPEEVYNLIAHKFGTVNGIGGHAIKCEVINNGTAEKPYLIVEIFPLELHLSVYQTKEDLVVQYSRNTTLRKVLADMLRLFSIDDNRQVQLWCNATLLVPNAECQPCVEKGGGENGQVDSTSDISVSSPPPPPPLPNSAKTFKLDQTLKQLDLPEKTVFTVEIQNADETWPSSRISKYGAITRSKVNAHAVPITPPGVCGLMNLGNTCFMNAALQCLSNTPPLTEFLLADRHLADVNLDNPLGMGGEMARIYTDLIKIMWSGCHQTVTPREFKNIVSRFAPQFSGFAQHDCQELMAFLLDGLHEDLNRVKVKPYIELNNELERRPDVIVAAESWNNYKQRNDSIIVDTFHSQLKSTLVCPECNLVSVTFDPFCYLTLPLPYHRERSVNITFVPAISKRPMHASNRANRFNVSTSSEASSPNQMAVRSILMESIMIPKVGCVSDIANVVAKVLNDSYSSIFNRQIDPSRLHVFHVNGNDCKKILSPSDTYTSYLEDIVVYEEDFVPNSSSSSLNAKKPGHNVIVYFRNKGDTPISRPFLVKVNKLTYEEIREAILRELTSIISPSEAEAFIESLESTFEEPTSPVQADISSSSSKTKTGKRRGMQNGSDPEEEQNDADDENQVNTTTGEDGEEEMEEDEDEQPYAAANKEKAYEISVVNRQGDVSFSTLCPGSSITADSELDPSEMNAFVAFSISGTFAHKYFPRNINNYGQVKMSNLLPGSGGTRAQKTSLTLDECINQFTTVEKLGADDPWYCPRCKKHQMANKKFDIWLLPNVLIIHLKRFSYSRTHRDKLDVLVDFPVHNLDMTPHVQHNPDKQPYLYNLIAVANHFGNLGGGHYTAHAKNFKNNKWYYFDDSNVSSVNESNAVGKPAYVLFYQRQLVDSSNGSD